MNTSRDGCIEFDAALMDAAAGDAMIETTREHVAHCERCTRALATYRSSIDSIALDTVTAATHAPALTHHRRSFTWMHAAAAIVLVLFGARLASPPAPPAIARLAAIDARPEDGAALTRLDADTARLESGVCTFSMGAARGVVETPLGVFSCVDCAFTLSVGQLPEFEVDDGCGDDTHVRIAVLRGLVSTSMLDRPRMIGAGQMLTISGP